MRTQKPSTKTTSITIRAHTNKVAPITSSVPRGTVKKKAVVLRKNISAKHAKQEPPEAHTNPFQQDQPGTCHCCGLNITAELSFRSRPTKMPETGLSSTKGNIARKASSPAKPVHCMTVLRVQTDHDAKHLDLSPTGRSIAHSGTNQQHQPCTCRLCQRREWHPECGEVMPSPSLRDKSARRERWEVTSTDTRFRVPVPTPSPSADFSPIQTTLTPSGGVQTVWRVRRFQ